MEARLRSHRAETHTQITRIEQILESLGESPSALKDAALAMSGNMAAIAHSFAPDEILKDSFANFAFENFEVATYKALIAMAEEGGFLSAVPLLRETLQEELAMAAFCDEIVPRVARKFLYLKASGARASH